MSIPDANLPIFLRDYTWSVQPLGSLDILWSTISLNPTNVSLSRTWNFQISGNFASTARRHITLTGNFTKVDAYGYNIIALNGPVTGTISGSNKVLDAQQYVTYTYDTTAKIITFKVKRPCCIRGNFLLNVSIADAICSVTGCSVNPNDSYIVFNIWDAVTNDICTGYCIGQSQTLNPDWVTTIVFYTNTPVNSPTIYVNTTTLFDLTPLQFVIVNATGQSITFGLFGYYGEPYCIGNGTITIPPSTPISTTEAVASVVTFEYNPNGFGKYYSSVNSSTVVNIPSPLTC